MNVPEVGQSTAARCTNERQHHRVPRERGRSGPAAAGRCGGPSPGGTLGSRRLPAAEKTRDHDPSDQRQTKGDCRCRCCGPGRQRRSAAGTRYELRVQPPRGPAHVGQPAGRQHRRVRVCQPGQPQDDHAHRELDPLRGPGRWPELLPVRRRWLPLQHQGRQQRRRHLGRHLPVDVQQRRQARDEHVPVRQRSRELLQRPAPAVQADVHAGSDHRRREAHRPREQRRGCAVRRGQGDVPELRGAAQRGHHAGPRWGQELRRPGRRPVLPGSTGVRPALRGQPQGGGQ